MAKSKYQSYDTETISRNMIKNAPYNPRIMDEKAKKRLRANIAKHGLVAALTWNKRTGNLVGGHQRLEQLDALEKSKDYDLTVCVVDVDEREEAALNVQLNNPSMQGEWDLDKLAMMSEEFDLDLADDMGFTETDIDFMFEGDDRFSKLFEIQEGENMRGDLDKVKEARKKSAENLKERNSINWFTVIVFENEADHDAFMREISIPKHEQYITEEQMRRICQTKSGS
jgi:hypothetical protein